MNDFLIGLAMGVVVLIIFWKPLKRRRDYMIKKIKAHFKKDDNNVEL